MALMFVVYLIVLIVQRGSGAMPGLNHLDPSAIG